jgi:hypothetical protein
VKPTRATQPYRRGARVPGPALTAMLKGRTAASYNPQDAVRDWQSMRALTGRKRPVRPERPKRPAR